MKKGKSVTIGMLLLASTVAASSANAYSEIADEVGQHLPVALVGFRPHVKHRPPPDFIDGVELWTAEDYMKYARTCKINMFT